jgi:hypothetical protein
MKESRVHSPAALLLAGGAAALGAFVRAQGTQAPVRILVGAPPGGTTDTMARALAIELGRALGRIVLVENRPGAGGNIAAERWPSRARRQHAAHELHQPCDQRQPLPHPALRSGEGLHAADHGVDHAGLLVAILRCRRTTCAS